MKIYEFHQEFAGTPLADRVKDLGGITLLQIYREIKNGATGDRLEELLNLASIYYKLTPKKMTEIYQARINNACSNPLCPTIAQRIAPEMCPCRIAAQDELSDALSNISKLQDKNKEE